MRFQCLFEELGVPAGPIASVEEVLTHPQVQARGLVLEHEQAGEPLRTVASATGYDASKQASLAPPRLGEHGLEILRKDLGYDDERLRGLIEVGALYHVALP